ncbi:MAG: HEAT repeat domain-containing protein [Pseudomonadota bacterium]|uniref:HEAT repeat domain-containing protein n=1 Tax=Sphingomonas sp. ERG5 TaxID=1381597 RepID=UPI00054B40CC|nr:HEAT repeat domain-containing protein [Sphingomonas sp. ERG5]
MEDGYTPTADFLVMVANDEIPLTGSDFADHNLRTLIAYTRDEDVSNRDWATMLLAQQEIDTSEIRDALVTATADEDSCVRGEALQGLADRDAGMALPILQRELEQDDCAYATFQAARIVADPSLLKGLRRWVGRGGAPWIDDEITDAIAACAGEQSQDG